MDAEGRYNPRTYARNPQIGSVYLSEGETLLTNKIPREDSKRSDLSCAIKYHSDLLVLDPGKKWTESCVLSQTGGNFSHVLVIWRNSRLCRPRIVAGFKKIEIYNLHLSDFLEVVETELDRDRERF